MKAISFAICVALISIASPVVAQTNHASPCRGVCVAHHVRISPMFALYDHILKTHGPTSPVFGPLSDSQRVQPNRLGIGATLRMRHTLSILERRVLEANGVILRHDHHNQPIQLGNIYRAWVPFDALDALASFPPLIRAEVAWRPLTVLPVDVTAAEVGALAVHRRPDLGATGKGVIVADIDSGIDVLHPAFFRADGGYFSWIDVNANNQFDLGVDAIDYNQNGKADRFETARLLEGVTVEDFSSDLRDGSDGQLNASTDWVYADSNNDFTRNTGSENGFLEADPAYGEPLFVVDDVNGNDKLDVHEKLVLLKTSKIRKYIDVDRVYTRGVDLIEAAQANGLEHAFHGTGVAGILLGGQRHHHKRIGLAPDAELLMYGYIGAQNGDAWSDDLQASFIQDALQSGANMILHEWTNPFVRPMDGSTNLEALMDQARQQGVLQVNPLGNLNQSQKHIERQVSTEQPTSLRFEVSDGYRYRGRLIPYTIAYSALQWRGDQRPEIRVVAPDGQSVVLTHDPNETLTLSGAFVTSTIEQTSRGTTFVTIYIFGPNQQTPLLQGQWRYEIEPVTQPMTVFGRVADYYSNWGVGIRWVEETADQTTLSFPSTADSAIGVAAYAGRYPNFGDGSMVGQLRAYSGRGPRVDGQLAVDIAAPDDPLAPLAATPEFLMSGYGHSWYTTFGGTSGAGPHVAAALALSMEREPSLSVQLREQRLFDSARKMQLTPFSPTAFPSSHWGWGKLDVYRFLYGEVAPTNASPEIFAMATGNMLELVLDASESTDPDGDMLQARFDLNYDGQYDVPWGPLTQTVPLTKLKQPNARSIIRVQVRDTHGATASQLIWFDPHDTSTMEPVPDMGIMDMVEMDSDQKPRIKPEDPSCLSQSVVTGTPKSPLMVLLFFFALGIFRQSRRAEDQT